MKIVAMIPARLGSQRLSKKNLRHLNGIPLVSRALKKCLDTGCFDEIWLNSEDLIFKQYADEHGVNFYKRPAVLSSNEATSENFVHDFLCNIDCDYVVQVHSIAPLLSVLDVIGFVQALRLDDFDCLLSVDSIQIECAYRNQPVNFSLSEKTNSQELIPIQRISWSLTGWRRSTFLSAAASGECATYAGRVGFHPLSPLAGHVIKTERDLQIAEALLPLVEDLPE
jgi:CMP-N-acetylneuraminic acid synthetase